jgi:hypothetical protein
MMTPYDGFKSNRLTVGKHRSYSLPIPVYGIFGVWCMVYGVWCMVYGVWCMVYGVWCMVYGVWCMVYGVWCMVYGVRCTVVILTRHYTTRHPISPHDIILTLVIAGDRR